MLTKQVDCKLKALCDIVVAGKDGNISALSKPALDELLKSLGQDRQRVLQWCRTAAEADDMLQNSGYEGGYDGDNSYSFAFFKKDKSAVIKLGLDEVRAIAEGRTIEVKYDFSE